MNKKGIKSIVKDGKLNWKKDIKTEFLPSALEIIETPASPLGGLTIWLVFILIMTAIIWSFVSKVDEIAVARGKIVPDGNVKVIQSLEGGIIRNIHVKEGESVKKGQLLIELDADINVAELEKYKNSLQVAKLEKDFYSAMASGDDSKINKLKNNKSLLLDQEVINTYKKFKELKEKDFLEKQKSHYLNYQKSIEELEIAKESLKQKEKNIEILKDEEEKYKKLFEDEAVSEEAYEKRKNDLENAINEKNMQEAQIAYYEKQTDINMTQKNIHDAEYNKEIMNQIISKDKEIQKLEKEVIKLEKRLTMQRILSPVDGTILAVGTTTIGGVVTSAKPIITIVPKDTSLLLEASILNKDIGFVHEGQKADIKLDTFPFQKYGTIEGEIVHISPDAIKDERLGYIYKAKIKPNKNTILINKKDVSISAGMTSTAEIKTGKRRVIEFFLPGMEYLKESFEIR
ncbi:MAG: HlyD family type I secretion periplasmic adaptor subunit [Tepidibacter sp.]|uniref:HlyD family type I secretion periplasmic adaptor subunit n=1 Tax=Tepidibacter sp. TaxID=2529387 RepID=UPI0025E197E2|nr:HlyD family type I secretion periplasmic adaptor subunit [Tepidibacter sp.]MCT4507296.1 HlyD family type I secretion periplasmic adaptor subunit [Tepidibacter sp.]